MMGTNNTNNHGIDVDAILNGIEEDLRTKETALKNARKITDDASNLVKEAEEIMNMAYQMLTAAIETAKQALSTWEVSMDLTGLGSDEVKQAAERNLDQTRTDLTKANQEATEALNRFIDATILSSRAIIQEHKAQHDYDIAQIGANTIKNGFLHLLP